jgi:hypothetical protein
MAILGELILIIVHNVSHRPMSVDDLVFVAIQGLRLSLFFVLPFLYFVPRSCTKGYIGSDPERQSLLKKHLCRLEARTGPGSSGTTTNQPATQGSSTAKDSDTVSEDSWLAQERKAKDQILKRLKQDGNWFTYLKGFSVS